jgi:ubiquinone/menaquinone biosynthesis C-methylase UbiE
LGAGEGRLESLLKPGNIVGLDENIKLLDYAKKSVTSPMRFIPVVGSLFSIPFQRESFASVVCINTLENYPPDYVLGFLDKMLGLLKKAAGC